MKINREDMLSILEGILEVCTELSDVLNITEGVKIHVEHEGVLEVPKGKKFYDLPISHFEKLIEDKGYEKIIRALTNLEVWNKKDDPSIASKASHIADALKKKFRPEEG